MATFYYLLLTNKKFVYYLIYHAIMVLKRIGANRRKKSIT